MRFVARLVIAALVLAAPLAVRGETAGPWREQGRFLAGADISMLPRIEELGGKFEAGGAPGDLLGILKKSGCTAARVRLFVNPDHRDGTVNDLSYTLALAARIKAAGLALILDLHYSDTWADPGHQTKPAAWSSLDFEGLEREVEEYTAAVVRAFRDAGALPDIVQIGNEVTAGMLWPDGRLDASGDTEAQWNRFARLLEAGVRGARAPLAKGETLRVMIHIDRGGDRRGTKWFFDHLLERGVPFDVIGLSYYPWWHGSLDELRENLAATATAYGKDVMIVETAYPHRGEEWWKARPNMAWPISPEGQRAFLADLAAAVRGVPAGRGAGILYWYPESIPVPGLEPWEGGALALFDSRGEALPGLAALGAAGDPGASGKALGAAGGPGASTRAPASCRVAGEQASARAAGAPRYRLSTTRDGWIAGAAVAIGAAAVVIGGANESITAEEVARLSRDDVNRMDRGAIDRFSDGLSDASWAAVGVVMAAPLALLLDARVRDDRRAIAAMCAETMALGAVLPELAKTTARRFRPYAYRADVPLSTKLDSEAKGSFFSRHATLAFASAVFLCSTYDEYHPESRARPYLWTGSLAAAAVVGYMRCESGRHFPSDVLAGAAVGSALGYLVPRLHRVEGSRVTVAPFASPACSGLALRFEM